MTNAPQISRYLQDILIDGRRIEAVKLVPRNPAPSAIVMLHEGLGGVAHWRDFPEKLATKTGCPVIVYSRYGYGKSERLIENRSDTFMHREATVALPQLLQAFDVKRPILFGHSDGASIALIFAAEFPENCSGLILEAPHVFVEDMTVRSIEKLKNSYYDGPLRKCLARYHSDADTTFLGWANVWLRPSFRAWSIEVLLSEIRCPLLVLQGEQDEFGSAAQTKAISERVPQSKVMLIPNCGHSPHTTYEDTVLDVCVEFRRANRLG